MNTSKYKKLILEVLLDNPVHPNANELYLMIKNKYPEIGMATVYRNLDRLSENGEISRFNTGSLFDRYDGNISIHYHMICTKCGKVYDIPGEIIDSIDDKVNKITGHKINEHQLTFKGICRNCIEIKENN